jgi:hypothetical protein
VFDARLLQPHHRADSFLSRAMSRLPARDNRE